MNILPNKSEIGSIANIDGNNILPNFDEKEI